MVDFTCTGECERGVLAPDCETREQLSWVPSIIRRPHYIPPRAARFPDRPFPTCVRSEV